MPDETGDNFGGDTPGAVLELPDNLDLVSDIGSLPDPSSEQGELETKDGNYVPSVASHDEMPHTQPFDLRHLETVVNEAHMQNGVQCNLKLPWECGVMSDIFGTSSMRVLPKVETPIGCIDLPVRCDPASTGNVRVEISTKTVFQNCVKFNMNGTKLDSEEAQWDVVMQRWESIIMHAPEHSKIGRYDMDLEPGLRTAAIKCVFKGKAA